MTTNTLKDILEVHQIQTLTMVTRNDRVYCGPVYELPDHVPFCLMRSGVMCPRANDLTHHIIG